MAKAIAVAEETPSGLDRLKSHPQRLRSFLGDVRKEMRNISTPSREEVQSTTIIVLITVFAFAAYFALVDYVVGHSIGALLDKLTSH